MDVLIQVLVVEDDDPTSKVLSRLLGSIGMQVNRVGTVGAAIEAIKSNPSLVVLDLMLPDGTGVDVLEAIRRSDQPCKVAIVSASNDSKILSAIAALKPDAIFSKPLAFSDLVDWISGIYTEDPTVCYRLAI